MICGNPSSSFGLPYSESDDSDILLFILVPSKSINISPFSSFKLFHPLKKEEILSSVNVLIILEIWESEYILLQYE